MHVCVFSDIDFGMHFGSKSLFKMMPKSMLKSSKYVFGRALGRQGPIETAPGQRSVVVVERR